MTVSLNKSQPPDIAARDRALDPNTSFIVQAPAGSGKTTLLVARYLVLLARVNAPEEVLAVTFTRKAANEMRGRVIDALALGRKADPPESTGARLLWQLGQAALARDEDLGWNLERNPARLRIQTIDALSHGLARQMPVLSRFGSVPATREDLSAVYTKAARRALQHADARDNWAEGVEALMLYLDNDHARVEGLLATMLGRRDQWIRHLHHRDCDDRGALESALGEVIDEALETLRKALVEAGGELRRLIGEAATNVDDSHSLRGWAEGDDWPAPSRENLSLWLALSDLLLTTQGTWRRQFNKNQGVPAKSSTKDKALAARYVELKRNLENASSSLGEQNESIRTQLESLRSLPAPAYSDAQWSVLQALFDVLFVAVGYLQLEFAARSEVDFSEVSQRAVLALGNDDAPTDLALALDYRIQHILVDEFQDTSFSQFLLLERLTAGWSVDDGRTLFLVGDPMQSIYRFREADVGLFLWARQHGIGSVALESLTLTANFRSTNAVVDWINTAFDTILPAQDDVTKGAVRYSAAVAMQRVDEQKAVFFYPQFDSDADAEARSVVDCVKASLERDATGSVALLLQARSHFGAIAPALKEAGVEYAAVDIETLSQRALILDLLSLLRSLTHLGDRIAWLSVLRAPWCGLLLNDLKIVADNSIERTVWCVINSDEVLATLSEDAAERCRRLRDTLAEPVRQIDAYPYAQTVRAAWFALGGPALVSRQSDLSDAQSFFDLVDRIEQEDRASVADTVALRLKNLYAASAAGPNCRVQIMTIHKSKGLEFDTVVLPGLGRRSANDQHRLMYWLEYPSFDQENAKTRDRLIFAPIKAAGQKQEPIYDYVRRVEKTKSRFEQGRLLYVAVTRAKKRLHLFGNVRSSEKDGERSLQTPSESTPLGMLWPVLSGVVQSAFESRVENPTPIDTEQSADSASATLKRVSLQWRMTENLARYDANSQPSLAWTTQSLVGLEFDWAQRPARLAGTVVHRMLKRIADEGVESWDADRVASLAATCRLALSRMGLDGDLLERTVLRSVNALQSAVTQKRGRWVLSEMHTEKRNEWALTGMTPQGIKRIVIDRSFVDDAGARWIIDFKTGVHLGDEVEQFLDEEVTRYKEQLDSYASFLQQLDSRPIRLALYYPLLDGWREWDFVRAS